MPRPEWWQWELELTSHLEKRMEERGFSEIELRAMIQRAHGYSRQIVQGRWVLHTRHSGQAREVIVEPDTNRRRLVVVTAYSAGQ